MFASATYVPFGNAFLSGSPGQPSALRYQEAVRFRSCAWVTMPASDGKVLAFTIMCPFASWHEPSTPAPTL